MPLARHHICLFIFCLCIVAGLVFIETLTEKPISGDEAVQVAIHDPGVRERIGSHAFEAGTPVSGHPASTAKDDIFLSDVWVVPVTVHYDSFAYIYHVDVTKGGKVYGISRPSHITNLSPNLTAD